MKKISDSGWHRPLKVPGPSPDKLQHAVYDNEECKTDLCGNGRYILFDKSDEHDGENRNIEETVDGLEISEHTAGCIGLYTSRANKVEELFNRLLKVLKIAPNMAAARINPFWPSFKDLAPKPR